LRSLRSRARPPLHQHSLVQFPSSVYTHNGTLFDTGVADMWPLMKEHLKGRDIRSAVLTHHHEDHSGNICNILRSNYYHVKGGGTPDLPNKVKVYASDATMRLLAPIGEHAPVFPMMFYEHLLYGRPSIFPGELLEAGGGIAHPLAYPPGEGSDEYLRIHPLDVGGELLLEGPEGQSA
jgi:glyoxylase-like metal-dependent hydrolase (beta-lactamase superfamily II)